MAEEEEILDRWITAKQAAEIISRNSGKTVPPAYINQLVKQERLKARKIDERTNLYDREQVAKIVVGSRGGRQKRRETQPKTEKSTE